MLIKTKNVTINVIDNGISEDGKHHTYTQEFIHIDLPEVNLFKLGHVLDELRKLAQLIDKELTASHSADTLDDIMSNIEIIKKDDGALQIVIIDPTTSSGALIRKCQRRLHGKDEEVEQLGVLATYGPNTASLIITHPKLKGALLPQKNDTAYVINIDNQLQWTWNADGTPVINTVSEAKEIDELLERRKIPANCADTELLEMFASAVASAYICNVRDRITVNYPSFFREMGTKPGDEKNHHTNPMDRIKQLENVGGVLVEQKKIQRVFVWVEIDDTNKTLTFESPYLYSIMDMLKANPAKVSNRIKNDRPMWSILGVSFLGKGNRASAKNKITIQVAEYLTVKLHQHGNRSDATRNPGKTYKDKRRVTCEVSYNDIILNCPRLSEAIEKSPNRTTQILQRSILGPNFNDNKRSKNYHPQTLIEEYLQKYFTVFEYWKDLKIKVAPVSVKTLDNKIVFTHHGYNGDFKNPLNLPSINGQTTTAPADYDATLTTEG